MPLDDLVVQLENFLACKSSRIDFTGKLEDVVVQIAAVESDLAAIESDLLELDGPWWITELVEHITNCKIGRSVFLARASVLDTLNQDLESLLASVESQLMQVECNMLDVFGQ